MDISKIKFELPTNGKQVLTGSFSKRQMLFGVSAKRLLNLKKGDFVKIGTTEEKNTFYILFVEDEKAAFGIMQAGNVYISCREFIEKNNYSGKKFTFQLVEDKLYKANLL